VDTGVPRGAGVLGPGAHGKLPAMDQADLAAPKSGRIMAAWLAAGVLAVAIALIITFAVLVGGRGRDGFDQGSVDQLTQSLQAKGVTVCARTGPDGGQGSGGAESVEVFQVALDGACSQSIALQVNAYRDQAQRDAAARAAEVQDRPTGFGATFTWHQFVVYLQADDASGDPDLRDQVVSALDAVGAR
jgi:hypothetical protein